MEIGELKSKIEKQKNPDRKRKLQDFENDAIEFDKKPETKLAVDDDKVGLPKKIIGVKRIVPSNSMLMKLAPK